MRKILLVLVLLLICGLIGIGGVVYRYPHVIAIADEGFPAAVWPARGIYVQVTGEPVKWPHKFETKVDTSTEAGKKLLALNLENETDALVAFHQGKLRYAYFRDGILPEAQFNSFSMAKSLIGYLVLKAIDEGEIDSVKSPIGEYLLDLPDKKLSEQTIEHFLTMRSGLDIEKKGPPKPLAMDAKRGPDKDASNPFTLLAKMHIEGIAGIKSSLKIPDDANYEYHYQNVNTALLGLMLTRVYKQPLNVILSEKIWKPSGATHARWRTYTNAGGVTPYCCLFASAEDWAKVAIFLERNGSKQAPFLSPESLKLINGSAYDEAALRKGVYGLHVRHDILDREGEDIQGRFTYFVGHGGQLVYLFPEQDLVVVRFGRKHTLLHSTIYYLWQIIKKDEMKDQ